MGNNLNIQTVTYWLITLLCLGYILHIGSSIILPIIFGTLFAIFMYPIDKKIIKVVKYKPLSIILSFLTIMIPIGIVGTLFSMQLMRIVSSLPSIEKNLKLGVDKVLQNIENIIPAFDLTRKELMQETLSSDLEGPFTFITQSLVNTTSILVSSALTLLYTFFILYYRRSLRNFIVFQFKKRSRPDIQDALLLIKETIQAYIGGLGLVIIILTVLNSIGLLIIGVEYAIFWGALAGILAIIPYIGTMLGGLLPALYSLATSDNPYEPLFVLIFYGVVQQIEGNLITPKVVGDKVDINPLFAVISIIFFGSLWGVGGIILALPIISILRIIFDHFEETKPIALLLSTDIDSNPGQFKELAES